MIRRKVAFWLALAVSSALTMVVNADPNPETLARAGRCGAHAWFRHAPGEAMVSGDRFRALIAASIIAGDGDCVGGEEVVALAISNACRLSWVVGDACVAPPPPPTLPPPTRLHLPTVAPTPRPDPCAPPTRCTDQHPTPPVVHAPPPPNQATGVTANGTRFRVRRGPQARNVAPPPPPH